MKRYSALLFLVVTIPLWGQDSTAVKSARPTFIITPRLNSAGHFPFTGALLNNNVNADINVYFEHRGYGFFIFKSQDLEDGRSYINYLQPGIFKKFTIASKVRLGVFFGYLFSQTTGFMDHDSDYYAALVAYWTIAEGLKLENTAMFFDLTQSEKFANRFLLSYTIKGFKIDGYLWHRFVPETEFHATSASLALTFPGVKLSDRFSILSTVSYQGYLTDRRPDFALVNGWLFTVAFPVTVSK